MLNKTCTSFYYNIAKCRTMAMWKYLKAPKDGFSDPRGSLANEIPSRAIEQANQEVRHLTTKESKGKRGPYKKYGSNKNHLCDTYRYIFIGMTRS